MSEAWTEYNLFAHMVDRNGKIVAQKDLELYQYRLLRQSPGMLVTPLVLPTGANLSQGLLWFDVGLYERFSRQNVAWLGADGRSVGEAAKVGPVRVSLASGPPSPQNKLSLAFGEDLTLEGFDLRASATSLDVSLHWLARAKPRGDYVVSVQVLDAGGRLVAQNDAPPVAGDYPTPYWVEGEQVVDAHTLALPSPVTPGRYRVTVIVYDAQTQQRLRVGDSDGAVVSTISLPPSP